MRATTPEGKNLQVVTSLTCPSRVRCRDGRGRGREERRERRERGGEGGEEGRGEWRGDRRCERGREQKE